jgi:predicted kinase
MTDSGPVEMPSSSRVMLVALSGLPGTGKSTLARALSAELGAPVLDKDAVRAALFGPQGTDYSRSQDDRCMAAIYAEAARLADGARREDAARVAAILDGRTFSRHESVAGLLDAARAAGAALLVVECRCADRVAEARLLADAARGTHPAANRGVALHRALRAAAEALDEALAPALRAADSPPVAHLVLDTDDGDVPRQVAGVCAVLAALASARRG